MFQPKPTKRFILFTLTLLLLLTFSLPTKASVDENEDGELEELLALDEQVEQQEEEGGGASSASVRSSEAEVLTKAQRIVLELNHDNTKRVIEGNEFVLVLGYAPWCARSAELMPQFAEAATALKDLGSPLLMAKLDAERHPKTAAELEIKGFPTLLLFVNGTSQAYTGGFSAEEIVIWARKKTGEPVTRISSVTEAEELLKKHHIFVVGLFEKFEGPHYEEFVNAATADNAIQFVEVSNIEVASVLFPSIKQTNLFLGIVKSEPERYTAYEGNFRREEILQFLDYNKFPLVNKLTESNSASIYSTLIKLQSLQISNFYIGEGTDFSGVPTKMMTMNGSLRFSLHNSASIFGIHVSSAPINLVYSEISVATGQLKKYYLPRKSLRTVSVNLKGTKVPLYGAGSSLTYTKTGGLVPIPLTLKLETRARAYVVGKLVKTKHRKRISCHLVLDPTVTKPIKFKKSSCTYD